MPGFSVDGFNFQVQHMLHVTNEIQQTPLWLRTNFTNTENSPWVLGYFHNVNFRVLAYYHDME